MDRATITELFDYEEWAWKQIGAAIVSQQADVTKPAPGSGWPALRNCLAHMCFGFDV